MLTCKEVSTLISAQYDRRLGMVERVFMNLHLMMCRYCRAVGHRIALIQHLVGFSPDTDLSFYSKACLPDRVREKIIKNGIQADSNNTAGKAPP